MMWEHVKVLALQAAAYAAAEPAPAPAQQGQADPMNILWMILPFFAIMYFLMIRPNQKREKERQQMLANLSKGDKVITTGGILGTIVGLNEKSVVLRVSEDPAVKIEFLRQAVSRAVSDDRRDEKK